MTCLFLIHFTHNIQDIAVYNAKEKKTLNVLVYFKVVAP